MMIDQFVQSPRPAIVIKPTGAADISLSLAFAKQHRLLIAVRSTGHDYKSRSSVENGLLFDMSDFVSIDVNEINRTVTVGTGNTFGDILQAVNRRTSGRYTINTGFRYAKIEKLEIFPLIFENSSKL